LDNIYLKDLSNTNLAIDTNEDNYLNIQNQKILKEITFKSFTNNFLTIYGPECCGKTYFINNVLSNNSNSSATSAYLPSTLSNKILKRKVIRIYLDENTDIKSLMGNYICTERIGEFKWVDGPITSAYKDGLILFLENLHLATCDVQNLFIQMSKGVFYLQGKYLSIGNGLSIIATWSINKNNMQRLKEFKLLQSSEETSFVDLDKENTI